MHLKNSKTIVIKIGSSLLINEKNIIRNKWLLEFAKDIKELINKKKKCSFSKFRSNSIRMQKIRP